MTITAASPLPATPLLALAWPWWVLVGGGAVLAAYLLLTAAIIASYARKVAGLFIDSQIANRLPPVDPPPDAVSETFSTADGLKLRGLWLRGGRSGRLGRVIVFAHSAGEDATSAVRYADALVAAGYELFAYDSRGYGRSDGVGTYKVLQWTSDREVEDLASALRHVRGRLKSQGSKPDVGIMGISRGGATALLVAPRDQHVAAVAVDGCASTDDILWNFFGKWAGVITRYKFLSWKVIQVLYYPIAHRLGLRWAQRIAGRRFPSSRRAVAKGRPFPLLHIQAERDRVVNIEAVQRIYDAARTADKQLWIVPKVRHNEAVIKAPQEYRQTIVEFFARHLPPGPAAR
jgi:alpha-beta hydrolase superfamily lysophospholipase